MTKKEPSLSFQVSASSKESMNEFVADEFEVTHDVSSVNGSLGDIKGTLPMSDQSSVAQSEVLDKALDDSKALETVNSISMGPETPLGPWERRLFSLVSGMTTNNKLSPLFLLCLNVLQDMQLLFFSWLVVSRAAGSLLFLTYVFNPLHFLITQYSLALFIAAFILFAIVTGSLVYCSNSFSKGRFAVMWPLHLLRILSILVPTILYVPLTEILVYPFQCQANRVPGFAVACNAPGHVVLMVLCGIGAVFLFPFVTTMNLLFFDSNPQSKVGKASGQFDVLYAWVRIPLVVISVFVEPKAASVINFVIIGFILFTAFSRQPFYRAVLNNVRAGVFLAAWVCSACAIGYTIAFPLASNTSEVIFVAITLILSLGAAIGGFHANKILVEKILAKIYNLIRSEYAKNKKDQSQDENKRLFKSQMSLILQDAQRITKTKAVNEKTKVFLNVFWPEIAARFIQKSYLDGHAVTMAYQVFETGFKQFPRSARLHLLFLEYNRDLIPVPISDQANHISLLKKRQKLPLAERFHIYQLQQVHLRKSRAKRVANGEEQEEDGENANYMSFIEYQSLETSVRKYHVETLVKLRDLWSSIKTHKTQNEIHVILDTVSNNALQTSNLYSTLLKRFPNSKNMANLHARFISRIYADKDAISSAVKLSSGASNDSGNSKQSMLQRQKRELLTERLNVPMRKFMSNSFFITLLYVVLIAVGTALSIYIFETIDDMLLVFAANSSRTAAQNLMLLIRRMGMYSAVGDWSRFNSTLTNLSGELVEWNTEVAPYFAGSLGSTLSIIVRMWDGVGYEAEDLSGLEVSTLVSSYVSTIITLARQMFTGPLSAYRRPETRFLIDNVDKFVELFTMLRKADIESQTGTLRTYYSIALISLIVLIVMFLALGLGLAYLVLSHFTKRQTKMLNMLEKIPKNIVNDMITDLEEEIENVQVADDAGSSQKIATKDKKRVFVLPWTYLVALLAAIGCTVGLLIDINSSVTQAIGIPLINDLSTYRRAVITQINRFALDVMENDTTTYAPGFAVVRMREAILELRRENAVLEAQYKFYMPPYESADTNFFRAYRAGGICFLGNRTKEYCDSISYDNNIGYTKTLATSGVDQQLAVFLETAEKYLVQRDFSLNSTSFRLIERLTALLVDSISYKNLAMIQFYEEKSGRIEATVLGLASIIFLLTGFLHYNGISSIVDFLMKGFWKPCNQFIKNNKQLVGIFYGIPTVDKATMHEIHTFIESAGASL